jgi:hypothetical protein
MSTKFEQLLDLIVNEEMDKANELFHEIVVEKSREIYENLIADEEGDEEEEMEEAVEELEDSYSMDEADSEPEASGDEETDDLEGDIEMPDDEDEGDEEIGDMEDEGDEEEAMYDIKNAIAELEAAFAELEQSKGMDMGDEESDMDMGDEESDMDMPVGGDEEPMMGKPAFEGRRVTREYVEKVGNDWEKNSQKTQGQYLGAGTGEKDGAPQEGKSPISSGSGKPTSGANAKNIAQGHAESAPDGTTPHGKAGGLVKPAQTMNTGNQNVPGGKVSVKGLKKVSDGHGAERKGSGPGPVGAGTGDLAGQTSVSADKPFLKKL